MSLVKCVSILIGNSDNKLSQQEWSHFVNEVSSLINRFCEKNHFSGGPANNLLYQNWCFVSDFLEEDLKRIQECLTIIRIKYKQDSIAFVVGETNFL